MAAKRATMSAKGAAMSAKDATMSGKNATMSAKHATRIAKPATSAADAETSAAFLKRTIGYHKCYQAPHPAPLRKPSPSLVSRFQHKYPDYHLWGKKISRLKLHESENLPKYFKFAEKLVAQHDGGTSISPRMQPIDQTSISVPYLPLVLTSLVLAPFLLAEPSAGTRRTGTRGVPDRLPNPGA